MERAAFLEAIRTRLSDERVPDIDIPPDWGIDVASPVERFAEELAAVGGGFHRSTPEDVTAVLRDILDEQAAPRVVVTREDGIPPGIDDAIRSCGGEVRWWPETGREGAASADFGITAALWAVAETGTVVISSAPPSGRAPSLLPPAFVCFVPIDRMVPTIPELFHHIGRSPLGMSNLVLVTGPSTSGDIGSILVRGVHGPGEVHVVMLDHPRR